MQNLELYGRNEMENKGKTFFRKCLFGALASGYALLHPKNVSNYKLLFLKMIILVTSS